MLCANWLWAALVHMSVNAAVLTRRKDKILWLSIWEA
jgi:hypothetical protein